MCLISLTKLTIYKFFKIFFFKKKTQLSFGIKLVTGRYLKQNKNKKPKKSVETPWIHSEVPFLPLSYSFWGSIVQIYWDFRAPWWIYRKLEVCQWLDAAAASRVVYSPKLKQGGRTWNSRVQHSPCEIPVTPRPPDATQIPWKMVQVPHLLSKL